MSHTRAVIGTEPDQALFEHMGQPCILKRDPKGGFWRVHVGVGPGHPFYRVPYNARTLGRPLTRTSPMDMVTTRNALESSGPLAGFPDIWFFGIAFDYACDVKPYAMSWWDRFVLKILGPLGPTYKTMQMARNEARNMAEQLAAIATLKF